MRLTYDDLAMIARERAGRVIDLTAKMEALEAERDQLTVNRDQAFEALMELRADRARDIRDRARYRRALAAIASGRPYSQQARKDKAIARAALLEDAR